MDFKILGSGGCVSLPRPLCKCEVCNEARLKGAPYSRYGCSLYLEDLNLVVDTPEDIVHALNFNNIDKVETVLYSHMDPDHTLGMRVFEQLRLNWFDVFEGRECSNPIKVLGMPHVMEDLSEIKTKYGPFMEYYENVRHLIKRDTVKDFIELDNIKIHFIRVLSATVFVFESNDKKLIYAPCDVKPFPHSEVFNNADYLIIGNTIVGDVLKNGVTLKEDNMLRKELFIMDEIIELKNKYHIGNVIVTHLEEDWGKSYDDYLELQNKYKNIQFAYDGMKINL